MNTGRFANASHPAPLFYAQIALYALAIYGAARNLLVGEFTSGIVVFVIFASFLAVVAAYAISNESKLGYWLAVIVAASSAVPLLDELARRPSAVLHIDYIVAGAVPVAIFVWLMHPASRDFQRVWFR